LKDKAAYVFSVDESSSKVGQALLYGGRLKTTEWADEAVKVIGGRKEARTMLHGRCRRHWN